ncbi:1-acyl-sn-glycerol-3-phosphate acyltransferase [Pseudomonas sp. MAP12]|uniref:1-acyl-sn-glycerol-3-phosphate acyltransferase n=1 Tax=Geopseudomonas aromaticivorans TaxID=2849492 RepID=A0ABS6N123_9GAMM|nr:lysophospholipid acyltransferase family protein [Pseudomonas aromaticivorans]MBV2134359.1 1-acyl-sn-glycerol-3-phosphate acyltransferase [Pseudomonas aromaticivorans]
MRRLRLYARLLRLFVVLGEGALFAAWVALRERLGGVPMALRQRLTWRFMRHLRAALPFAVRIHGRLPDTPVLWLANHVSWVDIAVLGALRPLSFLAKAEVGDWPLAGWLARQAGTLFIRRGAGDSLQLGRQLAEQLAEQRHLAIFPEGTSSDGSAVLRFHPRLLAAAVDSGAALQPVAIRYRRAGQRDPLAPFIGDDELPTHLLRLFAAERATVEITLLEPIASVGLSRSELARRAHAAIAGVVCADEQVAADEAQAA